jgi:tetratricopeptide (TPR) repeat protein
VKAALLAALLAGAAAPARASAPEAVYPEIRADARYELFAMVQLLAGADTRYAAFFRHNLPYDRAAEEWFKPYARHPVVERYQKLTEKGFAYLLAYQYLFALGDPPELAVRETLPDPLLRAMGGAESEEEFRLLLADFARVSRFPEFYEKTAPLREQFLEPLRAQARDLAVPRRLREYTGMPVTARYTIIASPFVEPVLAITETRTDPDGVPRMTSLYGMDQREGQPQFRLPTRYGPLAREVVFEDLMAQAAPYRAAIEASSALLRPVAGSCATTWYECFNRNVSFAVGARLLELDGQVDAAREWPIKYARIGMPYIGPVVEELKKYEADRRRYKTLLDLYPRLIEVFNGLAAGQIKAVPFLGTLSDTLAQTGPLVVIAPAPGALPAGAASAWEALRRKRWPDAPVLSGEQALTADLKGKRLVIVGTPSDNPWLARRWDELHLPAHLEPGGLRFNPHPGEEDHPYFPGRLSLVSNALNPEDFTRPALLFTGVDERALEAALKAELVGGADYLILDGGALVKLGIYEKSRLPWRLK